MTTPRNPSRRTRLVLVGYDSGNTRAALDFCNRNFFWIPRRQRIMTANNPALLDDAGVARRLRGWQVRVGSNYQHEFSGWQEGLDVLLADAHEAFGVILVNDTIVSHRRFSLARSAAFMACVLEQPASGLVGFTDILEGGAAFTITGLSSRRWISTYLAFLGADTLARVDHRVWYREVNETCVPGGPDVDRFFSEAVSENLKRHLCRWLFERGWYRSEPLRKANALMFTIKARSIVNEKFLSIRAQHPGFGITDPFERYPPLARWNRRFERWRIEVADMAFSQSPPGVSGQISRDFRLH